MTDRTDLFRTTTDLYDEGFIKYWSNTGQTPNGTRIKNWSNPGQALVKHWSNLGQTPCALRAVEKAASYSTANKSFLINVVN
jgi:hypothetical protein